MRGGHIWSQADGSLQRLNGTADIPAPGKRIAQLELGLGKVWLKRDRCLQVFNGGRVLLLNRQRGSEIVERVGVSGIKLERFSEFLNRLLDRVAPAEGKTVVVVGR